MVATTTGPAEKDHVVVVTRHDTKLPFAFGLGFTSAWDDLVDA